MTSRVRSVLLGLGVLVLCLVALLAGWGLDDPTAEPAPAATTSTTRPTQDSQPARESQTRESQTRDSQTRDSQSGLPLVELTLLPAQVSSTVALIEKGGPFPYGKDGVTFANRERILPRKPSGFYREYTVPTPGSTDRGARRVVTGDRGRQFFYTGDHYASFVRIRR